MIIPMMKYTFMIYHRDYEPFLKKLQELGVLHIIRTIDKHDTTLKADKERIDQVNQAIRLLQRRNQTAVERSLGLSPVEVVDMISQKLSDRERINQQLNSLLKTIEQLAPWGTFNREQLAELQKRNIVIDLFSCSKNKFKQAWLDLYPIQVIDDSTQTVYFVICHTPEDVIELDIERVRLPEITLQEAMAQKEELQKALTSIEVRLNELAQCEIPNLNRYRLDLMNCLEFEDVKLNTLKYAEDQLMILQGWVSKPLEANLVAFLEQQDIYYFAEAPEETDDVPIQLKNNWFARLFEPIGKLYSLPAYAELDLTAFFAPFFMLFFGFCTADMGYGLAILAAATFFKWKAKNPAIKPMLSLLQFLGLSTTIMGFVMGSLVAYDMTTFKGIGDLIPIRNKGQIFNLALLLGVIQILFGVIMNFSNRVRNGGFKAGISMIGTFCFILSVSVMGSPMLGGHPSPQTMNAMKYVLYAGLFLIFFFNSPGKNIFLNLAMGLWEMYNIVTGFFGDLLSYIRLFALGVSGGILGFVINSMAAQFGGIPVIGPVIFLAFMIVGHATNIALGSLGGFVHPMRLTFVEFYKNSGFAGGGKEYKPFGYKKEI